MVMPTGSQGARREASATARVLVIDPHLACRKALAAEIATAGDRYLLVGEAAGVDEALDLVPRRRPHAIILEIDGPPGAEEVALLRSAVPGAGILVVCAEPTGDLVLDAITAGATGFVPWYAGMDEVLRALRHVAAGKVAIDPSIETEALLAAARRLGRPQEAEPRLTLRERETLDLLAAGLRAKEIAAKLATSRRTVETHLANAYRKLRVGSKTAALREYARLRA